MKIWIFIANQEMIFKRIFMKPYLKILRPSVCILTVLGLVVGALIAGTFSTTFTFALALLVAFLICGAGNVINDYFDQSIDKINAPGRPIPSGKISLKNALYYFYLLTIFGVMLSYFVSVYYLFIVIFNWVIASLYPWKAKKIPILKNVFVAYLAASSFLAAGFISGISIPTVLIFFVLVGFIVTLGREIIKDIEDVKGDKKSGIKTLPIILGEKKAKAIAYAIIFLGCIFLILPYYLQLFSFWYLIGAIPAILLCLYSIKCNSHKAQKMLKASMYLVILGFLIGVILS